MLHAGVASPLYALLLVMHADEQQRHHRHCPEGDPNGGSHRQAIVVVHLLEAIAVHVHLPPKWRPCNMLTNATGGIY